MGYRSKWHLEHVDPPEMRDELKSIIASGYYDGNSPFFEDHAWYDDECKWYDAVADMTRAMQALPVNLVVIRVDGEWDEDHRVMHCTKSGVSVTEYKEEDDAMSAVKSLIGATDETT